MVLVMPPNWIVEKKNEKIENLIKNKNKVHPASLGQKKKKNDSEIGTCKKWQKQTKSKIIK